MQDICREAGVSAGALYVYFASKEDLIAGICERDRAKFADELSQLGEAADLLGALGQLAQHYAIEQPAHKRILCLEMGVESTRNPAIAEIFLSVDKFRDREFCQAVRTRERSGANRAQARPKNLGPGRRGHRRWHVLAPRRRSRPRAAATGRGADDRDFRPYQSNQFPGQRILAAGQDEGTDMKWKLPLALALLVANRRRIVCEQHRSRRSPEGVAQVRSTQARGQGSIATSRDRCKGIGGDVRRNRVRHRHACSARGDHGRARGRGAACGRTQGR